MRDKLVQTFRCVDRIQCHIEKDGSPQEETGSQEYPEAHADGYPEAHADGCPEAHTDVDPEDGS